MAKRSDKYKPRNDGRYGTKFRTGRYYDNGLEEVISVYASSSKELEEKIAELKYLRKTGELVLPSSISFSEYCRKWLLTKKKRSINTYAMYDNIINKHLIPSLGNIQVRYISRNDCQRLIDSRFDHYETCNKIRLTMRQLQKSMKYDKLITDDFWLNIEMPQKPASRKRPLTDIEKTAVILADFSLPERAFVYFLYGCGLRREETIALQTSDIDLKSRLIHIRRVIVYDKHIPVLEDRTKTSSGVRDVPIPIDFFQAIQFYVLSVVKSGNVQLFTTGTGLLTKSSYDCMWTRIVRKMNWAVLDASEREKIMEIVKEDPRRTIYKEMEARCKLPIQGLTAHLFRHNYATLLYYSGLSEKKAIELMGHADGNMIRDVYAHLDEQKENTAAKLDKTIRLIS